MLKSKNRMSPLRRFVLQASVLAALGLGLVGGAQSPKAGPARCQDQIPCSFKKPSLMIALEYSEAMNEMATANETRLQLAVKEIHQLLDGDNGFVPANFMLGLMRYGHDSAPNIAGTMVGLPGKEFIDGVRIDVPLYDESAPGKPYFDCGAVDQIKETLNNILQDLEDMQEPTMGAWTRGGLLAAGDAILDGFAAHPEDMGDRRGVILLYTQGQWTNVTGTTVLFPQAEDPKTVAETLFFSKGISTYAFSVGDNSFADEIAAAGGTSAAFEPGQTPGLLNHCQELIQNLAETQIKPICTHQELRLMLLLDASSPMLNFGGERAPSGAGGWEAVRTLLNGTWLFNRSSPLGHVSDAVHVGLTVYGGAAPAEEEVLVNYGPCHRANAAWAIDPTNSCVEPGCKDPYGAPPITWTSFDGMYDPSLCDHTTLSHMPQCAKNAMFPEACYGSNSYIHRGLSLVQKNLSEYMDECASPGAKFPCDANTVYVNLLITDGVEHSTDAQAQAPLLSMFVHGATTYVLGVGELAETPEAKARLDKWAGWGSGGKFKAFTLATQGDLEDELVGIIEAIGFNPCCPGNECGGVFEEPIPEPTGTSTSEDTNSEGDTTGGLGTSTSSGDTTGEDPGDTTTADPPGNTSTGEGVEAMTGSSASPEMSTTAASSEASTTGSEAIITTGCDCSTGTLSNPWLLAFVGLCVRRRRRLEFRPRPQAPHGAYREGRSAIVPVTTCSTPRPTT